MRKTILAATSIAAALSLSACGPDGADPAATATDAASSPAETAESAAPEASESAQAAAGSASAQEPFGPACSAVPAEGAGSFSGMAQDPVGTAASNNPVLSTLVTAVQQAGLVDTLNSAQDITVFAPTNDAFAAVDPATLQGAMADPQGALTDVLTYHVVPGQLSPDELAGEHETLQGSTLTVSGSGEMFMVNGSADVVCGNVQTRNATVYIIDSVLMPQS
jgi:uncharacterized surface protein with fasciclin (FAS1) repeats